MAEETAKLMSGTGVGLGPAERRLLAAGQRAAVASWRAQQGDRPGLGQRRCGGADSGQQSAGQE
jgi:hypothetical protein